ncbi:MAG: hypothetical protein M0P74_00955 [Syntrophales bacterium]|jgi:hypothetical protein|nr:hypothetical protein [Syntrophales bacterium]
MKKVIKRTVGNFKARTADGEIITIMIIQEFIIGALAFGDTIRQESPGDKQFVTSNGRQVNEIDENTYDVFSDTGSKYRVTRI